MAGEKAAEKTVGVREAKNQLSALLKDVRRGREWVITDRGKPVARLVPVAAGEPTFEERMRRLEEAGILSPPNPDQRPLPPPIRLDPPDLAQRYLQEDRGE